MVCVEIANELNDACHMRHDVCICDLSFVRFLSRIAAVGKDEKQTRINTLQLISCLLVIISRFFHCFCVTLETVTYIYSEMKRILSTCCFWIVVWRVLSNTWVNACTIESARGMNVSFNIILIWFSGWSWKFVYFKNNVQMKWKMRINWEIFRHTFWISLNQFRFYEGFNHFGPFHSVFICSYLFLFLVQVLIRQPIVVEYRIPAWKPSSAHYFFQLISIFRWIPFPCLLQLNHSLHCM